LIPKKTIQDVPGGFLGYQLSIRILRYYDTMHAGFNAAVNALTQGVY
jgi:hypothetical protein